MSADLVILARIEKKLDVVISDQQKIKALLNSTPDKMMTAGKAAEYLGYNYSYFINEVKSKIPHKYHGGKLMFAREDVEEYRNSMTVAQAAAAI
jgi:hypothetical protein